MYGLIGIVVCGGESSRMGSDKSKLIYHEKPQYEHLAGMLSGFCDQIIISCNENQISSLETEFEKMIDLPRFSNIGPIGALLTAYETYPQNDFLFIGCDYPLIGRNDIAKFLNAVQEDSAAVAFYNKKEKYEPLLAWYAANAAMKLTDHFEAGDLSLQYFLRNVNAAKYLPESENVMKSADTPEDFIHITELLNKQNHG